MCACKNEEEDFKKLILHRKELYGNKTVSPAVQWMIDQCSVNTLFTSLPPDPHVPLFDKQTYQQWKAQYEIQKMGHPIRMRRRSMIIQPLSYYSSSYPLCYVESEILMHLLDFCSNYFQGMEVNIADPVDVMQLGGITKRVHKETGREQVLVDDLMRYLRRRKRHKVFCVLGVTIVDLYPGKEWNFSLGHASLTEGVAVCSFGRHFNSRASPHLPSIQQQIGNIWVLVKVAIHELCHVFGLSHCYYYDCCMNESSSIQQAVVQPLFLCPVCLRKLHKVLKFDIEERYKGLASQCLELERIVLTVSSTDTEYTGLSQINNASKWLQACLNNLNKSITH